MDKVKAMRISSKWWDDFEANDSILIRLLVWLGILEDIR